MVTGCGARALGTARPGLLMPHTRAEDVAHGGPAAADDADVTEAEPSTA